MSKLAWIGVLMALGCGGGPAAGGNGVTVSCNVTNDNPAGKSQCMEWSNFAHSTEIPVYMQQCAQLSVASVQTTQFDESGGCDLTNAVAGCQNASGSSPQITTWFYAPFFNLSAVQAACRQTAVMPPPH